MAEEGRIDEAGSRKHETSFDTYSISRLIKLVSTGCQDLASDPIAFVEGKPERIEGSIMVQATSPAAIQVCRTKRSLV